MKKFVFDNFDRKRAEVLSGSVADLSQVEFIDPWALAETALFLVEHHHEANAGIRLPKNDDLRSYLCRMHFHEFLREIGYEEASRELLSYSTSERDNLNLQEIEYCRTKDEFDGRLYRFPEIFRSFGMDDNPARIMTAIVGELGNNVFDHNLGNWPSDITGCIILAQRYGGTRSRLHVIVADFGAGFLTSLQSAYPELRNDVEAIQKGLKGYTGRIGEKRGNGLTTIQSWTIDKFHGTLSIHSGAGLASVDADGVDTRTVFGIRGTIAQLSIKA